MVQQSVLRLLHASARKGDAGTRYPIHASMPRGWFRATAVAAAGLLLAAGSALVSAQTATVTPLGRSMDAPLFGAMQSSDGNFYSSSTPGFTYSCADNPNNTCSGISRITPAGVVTDFHVFESGSTTGADTDGLLPNPIIEGNDGFFYGTATTGGANGNGTIFRINQNGVFTVLYDFPKNADGNSLGGNQPGPLIQGRDGNFYGLTQFGGVNLVKQPDGSYRQDAQGTLFEITSGGVFTVLHTFSNAEGFSANITAASHALVQGTDGSFYGIGVGVYDPNQPGNNAAPAIVYKIDSSGALTIVHTFASDGNEGAGVYGPLTVGADGSFYGASISSLPVQGNGTFRNRLGTIFKTTSSGTFQKLYTFPGGASGINVDPHLTLGGDGNFYGITTFGGVNASACPQGSGCGTFFQITPSGALTTLYSFKNGADGAYPSGPLVQINDGSFVSTTIGNAAYDLALSPALAAPVQLSFDQSKVAPNAPAVLTWKVLNAFSVTMQQCHASIQGTKSGGGQWSGSQTGFFPNNGNVYTGTATITPTANGTYTYALTCGGVESGFATLVVSDSLNIPSTLPDASVGALYAIPLTVFGGVPPYTTVLTAGKLPAGLSLDPTTGILMGTPTQFGLTTLDLMVTDSNTPKATVMGTATLNVKSSLAITTMNLIKGTIGTDYMQTLTATGGKPPYAWSVPSNNLPDGIKLDPATGKLSGRPTTAMNVTITLQVTDSEGNPAKMQFVLPFVIQTPNPIAAVEFTQAIQQYQSLQDMEASLTAGGLPVPMISNKPAVMRVYYSPVTTASSFTLTVTGAANAVRTVVQVPGCQPADERAVQNGCITENITFTPPSGSWAVTLTVTDSTGKQLEQETLAITSVDTQRVVLTGISACDVNVLGPNQCGNEINLLSDLRVATQVLPSASVTADITGERVLSNTALFTPTRRGTVLDQWEADLDRKLEILYGFYSKIPDLLLGQRTTNVGLYPIAIDTTGRAAGIPAHSLVYPDGMKMIGSRNISPEGVTHETGHTMNLEHTNKGNPGSVDGMNGCFGTAYDPETYWPFPDNEIRSQQGPEYGFNVSSQTVKDPNSTYDLMSYCEPRWISPIQYKRMIATLGGGTITTPSIATGGPVSMSSANPHAAAAPRAAGAGVSGPYFQISGTIDNSSVSFDPLFTQTIVGSSDPGTGTYSIQVQSASGQTLFTRYFTPEIGVGDDADNTTSSDTPAFAEWIPAVAGAARLVVMDPNGVELGTIALSGSAPKVAITNPAAGFIGASPQTVAWTIQDLSASKFTSRILYSADNGKTFISLGDTELMTNVIDFSKLPGSTQALIKIYVSDGVNTGSATSAPFSVMKGVPTAIAIYTPEKGALQRAIDPVYLSGAVYDKDDGMLSGAALQWSDSVTGSLGTGSPLSIKLSPGPHTITLTGTDSDGNAVTATTTITLAGGPPSLSLTTSPASSCVNATIQAAPGLQGASLSLVEYSLNGGAAYTPIPLNLLPFTFPVHGSGTINLVAVAADASGQVGAQSMLVSSGSSCMSNTLTMVSGSGQSAMVGTAFANVLKVAVVDSAGKPVAGDTVSFAAPASGAGATLSAASATTAADGTASVTATANTLAGSYNVTASAADTGTSVTFALTNTPVAVSVVTLSVASGSGQSATVGTPFAAPLKMFAHDSSGNAAAGIAISLAVPASGASATLSALSGVTGADGSFSVMATANASAGSYTVIASAPNVATTAVFTLANTGVPAVVPDFGLTAANASLTLRDGGSGADALTVTTQGGFSSAVTFTCSGLPKGATCTFSPATVTPQSGAGTSTLTITVPKLIGRSDMGWPSGGGTLLAFCLCGVLFRRLRKMAGLIGLCLLVGVMISGCGDTRPEIHSTVTVTGTSGTLHHTVAIALTTQY